MAVSAAEEDMEDASRFKVGDNAVHPYHGVGEVMGIETREIAGTRKEFYVLRVESGMKIMVPTDSVEIRNVITRKEAEQVLAELRAPAAPYGSQPWNRRYREYMEMLKSGSPLKVARVLRQLWRLKSEKDLAYGERQLLDTARVLLVKELALAKRVSESSVERELASIFD